MAQGVIQQKGWARQSAPPLRAGLFCHGLKLTRRLAGYQPVTSADSMVNLLVNFNRWQKRPALSVDRKPSEAAFSARPLFRSEDIKGCTALQELTGKQLHFVKAKPTLATSFQILFTPKRVNLPMIHGHQNVWIPTVQILLQRISGLERFGRLKPTRPPYKPKTIVKVLEAWDNLSRRPIDKAIKYFSEQLSNLILSSVHFSWQSCLRIR